MHNGNSRQEKTDATTENTGRTGKLDDTGKKSGLTDPADGSTSPAKRDSGITVLGHFPEYVSLGDESNLRRFDIKAEVWDKMSDAERWEANRKFLDRTIARGDGIILATRLDKVKPDSYFARELQYLGTKGYRPNSDGTRLIKGSN